MSGSFGTETAAGPRGWETLTVSGEIDMATAPQLERRVNELVAGGTSHLVLDLTNAAFIDSSGLGAIMKARNDLQARGGSLAVVCLPGPVRRVLDVSGVDQVVPVFARLEDISEA